MGSDTIKRLSYAEFLGELKERIRIAQTKAVLLVNKELISIYWDIGKHIVEDQKESEPNRGIRISAHYQTARWVKRSVAESAGIGWGSGRGGGRDGGCEGIVGAGDGM